MATSAPYWAKRTAIACPIPDVPPVTRTPLPFRPGIGSVRTGLVLVADMGPPIGRLFGSKVGSPSSRCVTQDSDQLELARHRNAPGVPCPRACDLAPEQQI